MSHLTELNDRIKATEVTKKTTNAMRLISMSTHTRLRDIKASVDRYKDLLKDTMEELITLTTVPKASNKTKNTRISVLIGSQKGLCGTYNATLALFWENKTKQDLHSKDLIVIGKQMNERLIHHGMEPSKSYEQFSSANLSFIAKEIENLIFKNPSSDIYIYSTRPKTFFLKTHEITVFNAYNYIQETNQDSSNFAEITEQTLSQTYNTLGKMLLSVELESLLIDALLSEASSRFISMDSAVKNADDLIAHMKLDYNKLRQSLITRELTDLAGSLMT